MNGKKIIAGAFGFLGLVGVAQASLTFTNADLFMPRDASYADVTLPPATNSPAGTVGTNVTDDIVFSPALAGLAQGSATIELDSTASTDISGYIVSFDASQAGGDDVTESFNGFQVVNGANTYKIGLTDLLFQYGSLNLPPSVNPDGLTISGLTVMAIPEPSTAGVLLALLGAPILMKRRRRKVQSA